MAEFNAKDLNKIIREYKKLKEILVKYDIF